MTLQEIANEMFKEADKYAVIKEVELPTIVQTRTHKKNRINKKWRKRYGTQVIFKKKTAKVLDVTIDNVLEFCSEKGLPLPDEFKKGIII